MIKVKCPNKLLLSSGHWKYPHHLHDHPAQTERLQDWAVEVQVHQAGQILLDTPQETELSQSGQKYTRLFILSALLYVMCCTL